MRHVQVLIPRATMGPNEHLAIMSTYAHTYAGISFRLRVDACCHDLKLQNVYRMQRNDISRSEYKPPRLQVGDQLDMCRELC